MSYVYLFTFDICKTLTWEKRHGQGPEEMSCGYLSLSAMFCSPRWPPWKINKHLPVNLMSYGLQ